MVVAFVVAALALVVVTITWGSIMDLGAGGTFRARRAIDPDRRPPVS